MTSSSDIHRLMPDPQVKATPKVYSTTPKTTLTSYTHSDIAIGNKYYKGQDHYTTMYNKMTQSNAIDDSKYETTLVDFKSVKDYSGVNTLIRLFINKINTKYSGQTALRKAFKMMTNTSETNDIGSDDLISALHRMGIWGYTDNDFNSFYVQLAGGIDNMITYTSLKTFIEKHNEFKQSCEI
jgi:hypothetical protein